MIIKMKNNEVISTNNSNSKKLYFCDIDSFKGLDPQFKNISLDEQFRDEIIRFENHRGVDVICIPSSKIIHHEHPNWIFIEKEVAYFVGDDSRLDTFYQQNFTDKDESIGQVIKEYLSFVIGEYAASIDACEEDMLKLEERVVNNQKIDDFNSRILNFKHRLLTLKRVYAELLDILEYLCEDNNDFYSDEEVRRFVILNDKVARQYNHVDSVLDLLSEIREAHQSDEESKQNHIMSVLTIVSVIFLPLTLIVGWYGMNLKMPEFESEIAYPLVIIACLIIVIVNIYYFKKHHWF